jgi:methyl-accepting chemotaxis protein
MVAGFTDGSISRRIIIQTALTGLIVAVIGATGLRLYDQDMLSERLQSPRAITELFTTYAQTLDARVRNGALTWAFEVKA